MNMNDSLTADEWRVFANHEFFLKKAVISAKLKHTLEQLHLALQLELSAHSLVAPVSFDPEAVQFVKGEHLEDCPYQYLDFPRYYSREEKFAFRSLCWWGHHVVFALIMEGPLVKQYRLNLFNRPKPQEENPGLGLWSLEDTSHPAYDDGATHAECQSFFEESSRYR